MGLELNQEDTFHKKACTQTDTKMTLVGFSI